MSEDRTADLQNLAIDRSAPRRSGFRHIWWLLLVAILGGLSYVGYFYYFVDDTLVVDSILVVSAAREAKSDSVLDATGYVVARRQASVSSKVAGKVTSVLIEEGMLVKKGQLLATLDDSINRAQLELSSSQLEATRSQLEELQVRLRQANSDFERNKTLSAQNLISESAFEQSELEKLALEKSIEVINRNIAVSQKTMKLQEQYLSDMEIRAPFDGIVVSKTAQPGEMIAPVAGGGGFTRTGICTIVDMDSLEVQIDVNESFINRVKPGQQVTVQLTAYPDTRMPAEVIAIIPTADRARSTVKVRVGFNQRDERVLPDMAVRVSFLEEGEVAELVEVPTGVVIPLTALGGPQGRTVWVIRDGVVSSRTVELGETLGRENTQVTDGLRNGERVVINVNRTLEAQLTNGTEVATN